MWMLRVCIVLLVMRTFARSGTIRDAVEKEAHSEAPPQTREKPAHHHIQRLPHATEDTKDNTTDSLQNKTTANKNVIDPEITTKPTSDEYQVTTDRSTNESGLNEPTTTANFVRQTSERTVEVSAGVQERAQNSSEVITDTFTEIDHVSVINETESETVANQSEAALGGSSIITTSRLYDTTELVTSNGHGVYENEGETESPAVANSSYNLPREDGDMKAVNETETESRITSNQSYAVIVTSNENQTENELLVNITVARYESTDDAIDQDIHVADKNLTADADTTERPQFEVDDLTTEMVVSVHTTDGNVTSDHSSPGSGRSPGEETTTTTTTTPVEDISQEEGNGTADAREAEVSPVNETRSILNTGDQHVTVTATAEDSSGSTVYIATTVESLPVDGAGSPVDIPTDNATDAPSLPQKETVTDSMEEDTTEIAKSSSSFSYDDRATNDSIRNATESTYTEGLYYSTTDGSTVAEAIEVTTDGLGGSTVDDSVWQSSTTELPVNTTNITDLSYSTEEVSTVAMTESIATEPIQIQKICKGCLKCICLVEGCEKHLNKCQKVGGSLSCGPYQLKESYWIKCGKPGLDFQSCTKHMACSELCIQKYTSLHGRRCTGNQEVTCQDYTRIHRAGPFGCRRQYEEKENDLQEYWRKVNLCCQARQAC